MSIARVKTGNHGDVSGAVRMARVRAGDHAQHPQSEAEEYTVKVAENTSK